MRIGDYETVRLIGKGGMSEVYEASNVRLGSSHALKLYSYPKDDKDVRSRFVSEGAMLAKMSHPRIVKVTDAGEFEGRPFFVMDLVLSPEGFSRSLAEVETGDIDEETVGRWYDDIRDGLAYIHGLGVVHRDLKLQNILIGPDNHVVIADFGISKVISPEDGGFTSAVNTIVGIRDGRKPVMGSLGYMAPELEMGVAASPKSDLYALGVIAYKLLTGTWCDSRTDILDALDTYDRVWRKIIPKLVHSNPEGRECLSYAEEKAAERERREMAAEEKMAILKGRAHRARHKFRYACALLLAVVAAAGLVYVKYSRSRAMLREAEWRLAIPSFEDVFAIPPASTISDGEDAVTVSDLELAQVDAWVLTHKIFEDLKSGAIDFKEASERLRFVYRKVLADSEDDIWGDEYQGAGDAEALKALFRHDMKHLSRFAKRMKSHAPKAAAAAEPDAPQ